MPSIAIQWPTHPTIARQDKDTPKGPNWGQIVPVGKSSNGKFGKRTIAAYSNLWGFDNVEMNTAYNWT